MADPFTAARFLFYGTLLKGFRTSDMSFTYDIMFLNINWSNKTYRRTPGFVHYFS